MFWLDTVVLVILLFDAKWKMCLTYNFINIKVNKETTGLLSISKLKSAKLELL